MNREQVLDYLRTIIVETRGCDESEVQPQALLQGDIGLESIDFLEMSFRMEEQFGFDLRTGQLGECFGALHDKSPPEDVRKALTTLRDFYCIPLDLEILGTTDPTSCRESVWSLYTVDCLVNMVLKVRGWA
jgi:acyl carrier protein